MYVFVSGAPMYLQVPSEEMGRCVLRAWCQCAGYGGRARESVLLSVYRILDRYDGQKNIFVSRDCSRLALWSGLPHERATLLCLKHRRPRLGQSSKHDAPHRTAPKSRRGLRFVSLALFVVVGSTLTLSKPSYLHSPRFASALDCGLFALLFMCVCLSPRVSSLSVGAPCLLARDIALPPERPRAAFASAANHRVSTASADRGGARHARGMASEDWTRQPGFAGVLGEWSSCCYVHTMQDALQGGVFMYVCYDTLFGRKAVSGRSSFTFTVSNHVLATAV